MATRSTERFMSSGTCAFCKAELAKNKITQHLKSCKQRLVTVAEQEKTSRKPKTRLFHILAEGQYSPQYWLHFEVPASEPLWTLDQFLKDMWIDDSDHLSGFTINGTTYSENYSEEFFVMERAEEGEEPGEGEEPEEEEITEDELKELIGKALITFTPEHGVVTDFDFKVDPQWTTWIADLKKPRALDDLVEFLKEERTRLSKEKRASWKNEQSLSPKEMHRRYFLTYYQKIIVEILLDEVEDRSMGVSLARVLKVGQKFSYIYDYGSSTYIQLRVIAEREGIVQGEWKSVQLLAQNNALSVPCRICGNPATYIAVDYAHDDINGNCYCDKCASKSEEDAMLPLSNSPRVGVL